MDKSMILRDKLIEKSQEAFIMAIEVYNKPSIKYRVEGFSFFICNAWELLLKAKLINENKSIYYEDKDNRTLTLGVCLKSILTNDKDPTRQNLERIIELRNTSTHFITEEYELIYVPLFQSCVINYTNKLLDYFNVDITKKIGTNFLMLNIRLSDIEEGDIHARYPQDIANKLLSTKDSIDNSIPEEGNPAYAVRVTHDWALVKNPKLATATISIAKDSDNSVRIVKKHIDPQNSYPYKMKKCLDLINRWIKKENVLFKSPNSEDVPASFNRSHFQAFCDFYSLKDNKEYTYVYRLNEQPTYSYSEKMITFLKKEIKKDPENIIQNLYMKLKS